MSLHFTLTNTDPLSGLPALLEEQRIYARKAVRDGLLNPSDNYSKSPFDSDLIYHQMFNLHNPQEFNVYNELARAWLNDSKGIQLYIDEGLNQRMINLVKQFPDKQIEFRTLSGIELLERTLPKIPNIDELQNYMEDYLKRKNISKISHDKYELHYHESPQRNLFENLEYTPIQAKDTFFKTVILESPFAGDVFNNVKYAQSVIHSLAHQGYAPSASHLIYTQMLDDTNEFDRKLGIDKGLDIAHGHDSIIALDKGVSTGMKYGVQRAIKEDRNYSFITLSKDPKVIAEVALIKNLDEAIKYTEELKQQPLFQATGYIHDVGLIQQNTLNAKSSLKLGK